MENEIQLCEYGCGQEAIHQIKSGKWCCSKSPNSCPINRKRNSYAKRAKRATGYKRVLTDEARAKMAWNKGLDKSDERIKKYSDALSEGYKSGKYTSSGIASTPEKEIERKRKLSVIAKNTGFGGYVYNSGRSKGVWYESKFAGNVYLRGSYELFYAKYLDDNNIPWKQNLEGFVYQWENASHKYYPDFYLVETNEYIETKGFRTEKDLAKWKEFPHKLTVLYGNDLKKLGM